MKLKNLILIGAVVCSFFTLVNSTHAQGTAFTYQGRFFDGPNRATGSYDLTFAVFTDSNGVNQIGGTLTNTATAINNGLFTVTLDFGPGIFTGNPLWLQIGVETNGGGGGFTPLMPLQPLTPTPYAIYSSSAGTASSAYYAASASFAGYATTAASAGSATTAATANGVAASSVTSAGIASGSVVRSLNTLQDAVTLAPGANVTITPSGNTLTIAASSTILSGSSNAWSLTGNTGTTPGVNFVGTTDNQPLEIHVDGERGLRIEPDPLFGVPNIIGGSVANFITPGQIGNVIAGGGGSSGGTNVITGGGNENVISGGYANVITNSYTAVIGGGDYNTVGAFAATIPGGYDNLASGEYSFAAGQQAQALHPGSFVWADDSGGAYSSQGNNEFLIRAAGGVGIGVTGTPDAALEVANGDVRLDGNQLLLEPGPDTSVGLGFATALTRVPEGTGPFLYGFQGGALGTSEPNSVSLSWDYAGDVWVSNNLSTASLTVANTVAIAGGGGVNFGAQVGQMLSLYSNSVTCYAIGIQNSDMYFRCGADVAGTGFAWYRGGQPNSNPDNNGGGATLMTLTTSGLTVNGTFVSASDRNLKENFSAVDPRVVLEKVSALPIQNWNYKADIASRHIGPMAQDFYAAFNVGPDDKHIAVVDEGGVALAAIQGLNQILEEKDAEIQDLKTKAMQVDSLEKRLNELEATVKSLTEKK